MSNPQANVNLIPPSEAYREATGSLVNRLSELMFGSLLAAYSLGFIGAIASYGDQVSANGLLGVVLLTVQYACISLAFAFLTTGFYLTYHVGMLTMPQLPFDRLGMDFTIAVIQALFFGFSMLWPALFTALLGVNIYISIKRKDHEYERLARRLLDKYCPNHRDTSRRALRKFRKALSRHLHTQSRGQLSGWAPVGPLVRVVAWAAIVLGGTVIFVCYKLQSYPDNVVLHESLLFKPNGLVVKWAIQQVVITVPILLATLFIYWHGRGVLEDRAYFSGFPIKTRPFCMYPPNLSGDGETKDGDELQNAHDVQTSSQTDKGDRMDEAFEELKAKVKTICDDVFHQR